MKAKYGDSIPNLDRRTHRDLKDLLPLPFRDAKVFRCYSAPSRLENCAKVLETLEERCQSGLMGRFANST